MEKFAIGLILGGLGGALLVTNNYKMRMLVKKGQEEMQVKWDEMLDDTLKMMEKNVEKEYAEEVEENGAEKRYPSYKESKRIKE